jgi:hypothetical protein
MGKQASSEKKATSSTKAKKPVAKKAAPAKAATLKTPMAVAKKPAKAPVKKPAPVTQPPAPTTDDISLRAYFISEKRNQLGLPGDSAHDWIEAERQLIEEAKSKKPTKKKAS